MPRSLMSSSNLPLMMIRQSSVLRSAVVNCARRQVVQLAVMTLYQAGFWWKRLRESRYSVKRSLVVVYRILRR